ncbi:PqqD family protein [Defluviimonas sp. WL0050]|uniref:PqqD family protein n=1 Tax=Albidovulum litorale TaxID=2984134 RepID=A0ABT2ZLR8_9RHOB|nr:PqqD family protein [Defluviimonas sp. WL0050]MCV2872085.1 PqqD family protein [Defluviimonas sp. WL0050]
MSRSIDLIFDGLSGPVRLNGCEELLQPIRTILPHWPFATMPSADAAEPITIISPASRGRYSSVCLSSGGKTRVYDAIDAVCDMIVELSWEMLRSGQWLMCLHAAAIEMAGRLVIVPNVRRSGKSTLTACLARRGYPIFSDDFVPVRLGDDGILMGHANGICPRLRLPLPKDFSAGFRDWVEADPGPANSRYKYLTGPVLPPNGTARPLGAIVILDRRPNASTELQPMDEGAAMKALLHQNFARSVHSATILNVLKVLLSVIKPLRLSYANAEVAADFLAAAFTDWQGPPPVASDTERLAFREIDEDTLTAAQPVFYEDRVYERASGITEMSMNGHHYLTDRSGLGIHSLNSGALAIWRLLEEPMRLADVSEVLSAAFPDVPHEQIAKDCAEVLRRFVENRLVTAPDK